MEEELVKKPSVSSVCMVVYIVASNNLQQATAAFSISLVHSLD